MVEYKEEIYQGIPASPGIVIGVSKTFSVDVESIIPETIKDPELEIETFKTAVKRVQNSLEDIRAKILQRLGSEFARIFEAQSMIVGDQVWNDNVEKRIRAEKVCAEFIYFDEAQKVIKQLGASKDAYLQERKQDIESVTFRLVNRLKGEKQSVLKGLKGATIVIARYLHPSDVLALSVKRNLGFATGIGGPTSHLALMAKSLSVPAVIGLGKVIEKIKSGQRVIIDGYSGQLIINPTIKTRQRYRELKESEAVLKNQLRELVSKPAVTIDNKRVKIMANIELPSEIAKVLDSGASGVGLYRTEYLFLTSPEFPSFDKQYKTYASILRRMGDKPVSIRTFDLGGDKFPNAAGKDYELNPFLGWRAIRVCLDRPDIFKTQLKALLKASKFGNLSIMIPMISNLDELIETKKIYAECKEELRRSRVKFNENIPFGIMLEVPSAVLIADYMAEEVDFFSIGTNDLIQYTMAVDRGNELLSKLYQSFHPSILGLIKKSVEAGHNRNIKVSVCGEMAADPLGVVVLAGLGVDSLSVNFQSVGIVKKIIRSVTMDGLQELANTALTMKTQDETINYLYDGIIRKFPDLKDVIHFMRKKNV